MEGALLGQFPLWAARAQPRWHLWEPGGWETAGVDTNSAIIA